jgi:DNA-binding CsgD family transcriptional regulator
VPPEASPAFIQTELGVDDVNQLRHLVRAPSPVGWLDEATHGDRMQACRYRLAMAPHGMGDELRTALMVEGTCWGLLCVHRAHAVAGFDAHDAALLAAIGPVIARALRRTLVSEQALITEGSDGPGVTVLNPDLTVHSSTPAAARWLSELADLDRPKPRYLPSAVHGVAQHLHAGGQPGSARTRVHTPSGRWVTVHAAHLDDASGRIAVVFEPTSPAALAPLIIAAYGLTHRESEVTRRLLTGLPRKTIASELEISLHTVNDHIKTIFDKTGASSAGHLRAQLMGHLNNPP